VIRRLPTALVLLLVAFSASVVAACGKEEASLLDRAFKQEIRSATLSMRIEVSGPKGSGPAFGVTMRGPFKDNGKGKLASFDWKVRGKGMAAGGLDARIVSSGRNVFVEYEGETYEVGEREIARFQRESRKGGSEEIEDLEDAQRLGLRLQDWFPRSDVEEDSRVGDEPTTRVSGKLDVSAALKDLRELASNPALAADPTLKEFKQLSPAEIAKLDKLVSDPRFAVDVAKGDGKPRRIEATMAVRERPGGPAQTVRVVLTLSDVDQPVDIQAPSGGKPIERLLERLGGQGGAVDPEAPVES